MLWPGPKSTASCPGTPRNAVSTSRRSRSPTAGLLEEPAQRLGAVFGPHVQRLDEAPGEVRRQIGEIAQDGLQEFALGGALHWSSKRKGGTQGRQRQARTEPPATSRTTPVIQPDCSEHRKSAACATSSGVARRLRRARVGTRPRPPA